MSDNGWHLDKRISLSHLVLTGTVIVSVSLGYAHLLSRVERADDRAKNLVERVEILDEKTSERFDQQERWTNGSLADIKSSLVRIEARLNRLADNGSGGAR